MSSTLANRLTEEGVEHLWVAYTDYNGRLAGRSVPQARFAQVAERGTNFAKANFNFTIRDEQVPEPRFGADSGDVLAVPDPSSVVRLPFHPGTALAFSYLHEEDGQVWEGCARAALRRAVAALEAEGLAARVAFEPEFYLFLGDEPTPAIHAGMYTIAGLDAAMDVVRRLGEVLGEMGVALEQIGKEYGQGQFEANVGPADPVAAADDYLLLRLAVRQVAGEAGLRASFMPKPTAAMAGCGLHVHLSLQDAASGEDRTASPTGAAGLTDTARAFIAGWLAHAEALTALGAPTPNSYKRLQPASWAPAHVCWGVGNRAALVRVPGPGARARLEFRAGDNTANPYLFLAGLLWAGLDGIKQRLDPGSPVA
ncbi:MAG: glutamine synthetase, partial [Thermomicrobiaceae bacterium]|nr:glutamine synthetase [Thermomicrobiaceae bacterium]